MHVRIKCDIICKGIRAKYIYMHRKMVGLFVDVIHFLIREHVHEHNVSRVPSSNELASNNIV